MAYKYVLYETGAGIAHVTMNRPEKLNAINDELLSELMEAMYSAEADPEVRVIILKGNGRAFSSGYDISPGNPSREAAAKNIRVDIQRLHGVSRRWAEIWNLSKPVIAQVHGYCVAGGTDLAMHCDLIVAADNAQFGFPAVRSMGSPPTHMWIYHAGLQWSKFALLTGDSIDGKTAERIGLAWRSVPFEELDGAGMELAEKIARIPWELLAANKSIVNKAVELMGRSVLQQIAGENDAIAHRAPVVEEFTKMAADVGLKSALEWRDKPFQDYTGR
jgi:enoyl-CoA hydratase